MEPPLAWRVLIVAALALPAFAQGPPAGDAPGGPTCSDDQMASATTYILDVCCNVGERAVRCPYGMVQHECHRDCAEVFLPFFARCSASILAAAAAGGLDLHGLDMPPFLAACNQAMPDFAYEESVAAGDNQPIGFEYVGCFDDPADDVVRDVGALSLGTSDAEVELGSPDRVMACAVACAGSLFVGLRWNGECFCDNEYGSKRELFWEECSADGALTTGVAETCVDRWGRWMAAGDGACTGTASIYEVVYSGTRGDEMESSDCVVVAVGPSRSGGPQRTEAPAGYVCPLKVSRENWLGGSTFGDTFVVQQSVTTGISVYRTDTGDQEAGWGLDLQFRCCRGTEAQPYLYLGCFNDNGPDGRDLGGGARQIFPRGSVAEAVAACGESCGSDGFAFFGVQWINECYCGNTYGGQGEAEVTDCDSDGDFENGLADLCGNGRGDCGNRNAVYAVGVPAGPLPLPAVESPSTVVPELAGLIPQSFAFVGCFLDSTPPAHLPPAQPTDADTAELSDERAMLCADACIGFRFFVLQAPTDACFCDNNYGGQGERPLTACSTHAADVTDGRASRNAVYEIEYSSLTDGDAHGETENTISCTSQHQFENLVSSVNAACCDEGAADCDGRPPTTCSVECASTLLPLQEVCGNFLQSHIHVQAIAAVKALLDATTAICHRASELEFRGGH